MEEGSKGKGEKRRIADGTMQNNQQDMAIPNVKDIQLTLIPKLMVCECNWHHMYHIYTHHRKIMLCTVM